MAAFRYRAVSAGGAMTSGVVDAPDGAQALAEVRQLGITPIEVVAARAASRAGSKAINAAGRRAAAKVIGEIGVLLNAGLSIDRALGLALENVERVAVRERLATMLRSVREGVPISRAIGQSEGMFPPMAQAMAEAGEANGRLGDAMTRLAATLERGEDLRQLVVSSLIYPAALLVVAVGVILLMLLFVVPQFETVFATAPNAKLPAASMAVMAASRFVRGYGWYLLAALAMAVLALRRVLRRPQFRIAFDRWVLRTPQLGTIVTYSQTAQFARTLAVLVDGGVDLPVALGTAQRSLSNTHLAGAVAQVAAQLKEGGGLSGPLAATGAFPRLAIGFFRTGEETSQLGLMLDRLADVLERDVRIRLQRLIAVLTPAITVVLGGIVAAIIASIMTAILGFNDLAVG